MNSDLVSQSPFSVLALIAAPAILTYATTILILSTSNHEPAVNLFAGVSLFVGGSGVLSLVFASFTLIRANSLAMLNISDDIHLPEAEL